MQVLKYLYSGHCWTWHSLPQGTIGVCLLSLIWDVCAVHITWQLWLGCEPPTCGCLCVQRNFTVLWKECWNVSLQIWKPCFNPSLWQSDEVLAVCLGPLVLLFFHWHHLSTFSTISPSLLSSPLLLTPPQTREKRSARPVCRSSGSREKSEPRKVTLGSEQERWWWGRWRSLQMAPASARSPRQTASPSLVVFSFLVFSCAFLDLLLNLYLYLITQVNNEPILIHSYFFLQSEDTKGLLGGKKEKQAGKT